MLRRAHDQGLAWGRLGLSVFAYYCNGFRRLALLLTVIASFKRLGNLRIWAHGYDM